MVEYFIISVRHPAQRTPAIYNPAATNLTLLTCHKLPPFCPLKRTFTFFLSIGHSHSFLLYVPECDRFTIYIQYIISRSQYPVFFPGPGPDFTSPYIATLAIFCYNTPQSNKPKNHQEEPIMNTITIPATYHADLNLHDTQIAIKTVKDFFQQTLSQKLNLLRVSAPTFVAPESGLNDNLNGVERPVSFDIKAIEGEATPRSYTPLRNGNATL